MSDNLKQKTAFSIIWSSIDKFGFQFVALLVGIITARLLSVDDFGLIGALAIFTQLSNVLIESGFSAALIRRENNTESEYSAAFYFNVLLSGVFYIMLYVAAPSIASYFEMPELECLSRFLFLAIICNSFGIIPNIILTKQLEFRKLMIANLASAVVSGVVTVILALKGYAYWAIAWQQLLQALIRVLLQWVMSGWHPIMKCRFSIIKELFSFSFVLIITSVVNTIVKYIYNWIIGKIYSKTELGYYSQAFKYQSIPSQIVSSALSGVAYPVISSLNAEPNRQLLYFRKLMRINAFLIFPIMLGLMGVAENIIEILLTAKWLPSVPYFKIMVGAAVFVPFQTFCLGTLNAIGKPKLNFMLEMIRNVLVIISLILFHDSIKEMLFAYVVAQVIAYVFDVLVVGHHIKYTFFEHLKDIVPYAILSVAMLAIMMGVDYVIDNIYWAFMAQFIIGVVFYFGVSALLGSTIMRESVSLIRNRKVSVE